MDQAFFDALAHAVAVAARHERELLAHAGVVTVGAGVKRTGGRITGVAAIVVTVRTKRSASELAARGEKPLPRRLDDVDLDVIELGKPVEAPEIVAAQARAAEVLTAVKTTWLKAPNVTGLGIGYKKVRGQTDFSRIALRFFVEAKLAPEEIGARGLTPIPAEIDGVPTDVEEMRRLRPSPGGSGSRDDRKDPLVGGLAIGVNTKPFWYGTLGAIVFDRVSGAPLVLSNQHVLDGPAGTEVVQPSPVGLDDSLDIGFQLDICNPLHFYRLDTPNTTVGSVLAAGAAAAALAAALSDEIDPTRRGQAATPPPPGAKTVLEGTRVRLAYPDMPVPGTHFKVKTEWEYTRYTDAGDQSVRVEEVKENPHVLVDQLLLTDRTTYKPGDTIRLFALILPEACAPKRGDDRKRGALTQAEIRTLAQWHDVTPPTLSHAIRGAGATAGPIVAAPATPAQQPSTRRCPCRRFHCTAILTPTRVDRAYPIVLREPLAVAREGLMFQLFDLIRRRDNDDLLKRFYGLIRYGCLYTGQLAVTDIPKGPWKHYLYVQTVNHAPAGMPALEAARIIGGLPVSRNARPVLDVACGPFVIEDGQFDVELI